MVNLTTNSIVRLFRAKRSGPGKWRAVCPVHGGKYSGPLVIFDNGNGNTGMYCFGQCDVKDILSTVGLSIGDLFADKRTMTPEIRQRLFDEDKLKLLERQHGLAIMAQAVIPKERNYWRAVERNIAVRGRALRSKLYPEEAARIHRNRVAQHLIKEYGFEELMNCLPKLVQSALINCPTPPVISTERGVFGFIKLDH